MNTVKVVLMFDDSSFIRSFLLLCDENTIII